MSRRAGHGGVTVRSLRSKSESSSAPPTLPKRWSKQTATSDVLEVISRSAFDLQAVFETVIEISVRLCGADRAFIFRFDGELLRMVVGYNSTPGFVEWVAKNPRFSPRCAGAQDSVPNLQAKVKAREEMTGDGWCRSRAGRLRIKKPPVLYLLALEEFKSCQQ
jgi:hypothetical protein